MRTRIPVYAMAHLSDLPSFPVSPGLYGSLFIPEMVWQLPFDLAGKFFAPILGKSGRIPGRIVSREGCTEHPFPAAAWPSARHRFR